MPKYMSPGVYVEEKEAGSRPIEGVGTAIAAFVGVAGEGPFNEPTLVTNWSQYTSTFGDLVPGSFLGQSVYGYFNNGGGACYVVRIGQDGGAPAARAELTSASEPTLGAYRISALEPGPAGNDLTVEVTTASEGPEEETFKLIVKRNGTEETYDKLTTKKTKQNVVTVVNQQSKLIQLEEIGKAGNARAPADERQGAPCGRRAFCAVSHRSGRLRRRRRRPHRLRRRSRRSTTSRWSASPT